MHLKPTHCCNSHSLILDHTEHVLLEPFLILTALKPALRNPVLASYLSLFWKDNYRVTNLFQLIVCAAFGFVYYLVECLWIFILATSDLVLKTSLISKLLITSNEDPTFRQLCPAVLVNLVKYTKHAPYHINKFIILNQTMDKSCITKTSRLSFKKNNH